MVIGGVDNTTCFLRSNFSGGSHLGHADPPPEREGGVPGHQAGGGDVEGFCGSRGYLGVLLKQKG